MPNFPLPVRADGSCSKLVDNKCSIYDERPAVCRVGFSRSAYLVSAREYMQLSAAACNMLQEAEGLGPEWRVKLD